MRRSLGIFCAVLVLLLSGYGLYQSVPLPRSSPAHRPAPVTSGPNCPLEQRGMPQRRLRMRNSPRPVWRDPSPSDDVARYAEVDTLYARLVPVLVRPGDTGLELAHRLYADVPDAEGKVDRVGGRRLLMALTFELNGLDDPNRIKTGQRILFYNTAAMSFTIDTEHGTLAEAMHAGRLRLDSAAVLIEGNGAGRDIARLVDGLKKTDPRYHGLALCLVVSNRTPHPQTAYIPRGRGFELEDVSSNAQHLIAVEPCSLRLRPNASTRVLIPAVCINQPKRAPEAGTPVALTVLKATGSLEAALEEPPIRTQLAVWDVIGWMREQGMRRLARTTEGY